MASNVKHGAGSVKTKQLPSKCYGRQPWLRLRSVIYSSAPPTLPNRSAGSAGGAIYEGVAYFAMSLFLTLGANGKTLKFWFFVIRVYYEKLGHMLKPSLPKFLPNLPARLKDIAEKQVPAELKPIVARLTMISAGCDWVTYRSAQIPPWCKIVRCQTCAGTKN